MRYVAEEDVTPSAIREYRMIPSERWKGLLGITPYDRVAELTTRSIKPERVSLLLNQHIGIPSSPIVAEGDTVVRGQKIAEAADGLSVPQHASIDGKVTLVSDQKITIERV